MPNKILKIKKTLNIDNTSYNINNLSINNEILIFYDLKIKISNLPFNTKEIWLNKKNIPNYDIKLPFDSKIKYYWRELIF